MWPENNMAWGHACIQVQEVDMPICGSHAVGQLLRTVNQSLSASLSLHSMCWTKESPSHFPLAPQAAPYKHNKPRILISRHPAEQNSVTQHSTCLDRVVVSLVELPKLPVGRRRIPPGVAASACKCQRTKVRRGKQQT